MVVLLISFSVLALAFTLTVRHYLIGDTVRSLYRVAETLSTTAAYPESYGRGHMRGAFFNLASHIAYAEYVLVQPDGTILDSSDIEAYPPGAEMINESFMDLAFSEDTDRNLVERERVAVSFPVVMSGDGSDAELILYSHLDVLARMNRSLLSILALALGAGTVVSLVAGVFATRVAVGPLKKLKDRATELAKRRFSGRLEINTGDELEELADTFNEMAGELAEYDRTQKEFFQKASHELKTPLMSVQGYAEALKDGIIPAEEQGKSLNIIIKESKRMKALVDEFIYLSKMETLKDNYNLSSVNLDDAVKEAVQAVQSLTVDKIIEIETAFSNNRNNIEADPEKIHRLLLNILSNSLRYAQNKITVTVCKRIVFIEDDGPGLKEKDLSRAFDPFYKGENGGSGLGLAISRAIVEKHGGSIGINNNHNGGARVTITFPEKSV